MQNNNDTALPKKWALYFFLLTAMFINCTTPKNTSQVIPPDVEKIPKTLSIHGDTRIDNYYWLDQRDNPKVIEYLKAENAYQEKMMKHTEKLQNKLYKEIVGRIKKTDKSVPYLDNGYYYYHRYVKGNEYPIYARKKGSVEAEEEILLNVPKMAKGYSFYQVRGLSVSPDNHYLCFGVDTVSRRKYTIHVKDLQTGKILADKIPNTTGGATWANDNKTIFYVVKDSTLRPHKVIRHILGTDPSQDVEIWHEKDNTFATYVGKTKSNQYIVIGSYSTLSTEMRLLKADNPYGTFTVFQKREPDHEYSIYHFKDRFYILTNWNAKNFRLMQTGLASTNKKFWKEVIPHRKDVLLDDIDVFKDYLALSERKDGLRQIRIIGQQNNQDFYLDFDEEVYTTYTTNNREFNSEKLRFQYSSLTTPETIYDYNMRTGEKELLKQEEVVGKFNPSDYQAERLWATARDGILIPISLVYKKGISKDSPNPCLLYGYGSYGYSRDPYFNSARLSLLNRGFIYAIAHVRGGSEMGRYWYEDGKLLKK
ncbi:MAG: prolyl oligopeptidase family serine peptidase, partial [bacterium]